MASWTLVDKHEKTIQFFYYFFFTVLSQVYKYNSLDKLLIINLCLLKVYRKLQFS